MAHGLIVSSEFKAAVNERLLITVLMLLSEYKGGEGVESRCLDLIELSDSVPPGALVLSVDWVAGMLGMHPKDLPSFTSAFITKNNVTESSVHCIKSELAIKAVGRLSTYFIDARGHLVREIVELLLEGCKRTQMYHFGDSGAI